MWPKSSNSIISTLLFQNKDQDLSGVLVLTTAFSSSVTIPGQTPILSSIELKIYTFLWFDCLLNGVLAND